MAGTARAASSVLTVTRTSSLPAACNARTCAAVAATSAVSVLVMDWTTIGCALPTRTPPTLTMTVGRRVLTDTKYRRPRWLLLSLEDSVLDDHANHQRLEHAFASHRCDPTVRSRGGDADPQRLLCEEAIHGAGKVPRNGDRIGSLDAVDGGGRDVERGRRGVCRGRISGEEKRKPDRPRAARIEQIRIALGDPHRVHDRFSEPRRQIDLLGRGSGPAARRDRSEEHTSELQSHSDLVCRLLLEKKK